MSVIFTIENSSTFELDTKRFCSSECAEEYLFDEYEIEGVKIIDGLTLPIGYAKITCYLDDGDVECLYGC